MQPLTGEDLHNSVEGNTLIIEPVNEVHSKVIADNGIKQEVKGEGVVGQQPFGGGRASGTNDKAGSYLNLLRWVSPRTIKEVYNTPKNYRYPFLKN